MIGPGHFRKQSTGPALLRITMFCLALKRHALRELLRFSLEKDERVRFQGVQGGMEWGLPISESTVHSTSNKFLVINQICEPGLVQVRFVDIVEGRNGRTSRFQTRDPLTPAVAGHQAECRAA